MPEIKVIEVIEPATSVKLTNGVKGDQGKSIVSASFVDNDIVFVNDENEEIVIEGGKTALKGSSAYQVWLEQGNTGTVEDYLASLVGPQGKSAYELAVIHGYNGTEEEFALLVDNKVDKVEGKALSTNDYTNEEKNKVNKIYLCGNRFVKALGTKLSMGLESSCLLLQGDSTGNDDNEWFYQTMQWLASKYPKYSFLQRSWSDTHQNYSGLIKTIQTGDNGDAYITFNGISNNLSAPDTVANRITGDLDVIVKLSMNDWTPATVQVIASKFGLAGNRGWAILIGSGASAGKPSLWWSPDGSALLGGEGSALQCSEAIPVLDGLPIWLRVTLDVDNGSGGHDIKYYISTDGITWTQLGTTRVGVGITSIFPSTALLAIGMRDQNGGYWAGKAYKAIIKSGIDGKIIASPNAGMAHPVGATSMKDTEGNTWTISGVSGNGSPMVSILNCSKPGASLAYSADVTRFGLQTPMTPDLSFISYSHNEGAKIVYQTEYEGLASQLLTKYPNTGIVCVTQSPQKSPMSITDVNAHTVRNRQVSLVSAKNNYGLIDTFRAFIELGDYSSYILSDGVHPAQSGDDLWRDVAIDFLKPAVKN